MDIYSADSFAGGFGKWAGARQPDDSNNRHHGASAAVVIADPDDAAMTPIEQPHRPWLVPGAGRL